MSLENLEFELEGNKLVAESEEAADYFLGLFESYDLAHSPKISRLWKKLNYSFPGSSIATPMHAVEGNEIYLLPSGRDYAEENKELLEEGRMAPFMKGYVKEIQDTSRLTEFSRIKEALEP